VSKFTHNAVAAMSPKQKKRHDIINDPILGLSDADLETWLDANVKSANDTKAFLKKLTRIVATLARKGA
jgi:hypothetical protein